MEILPNIGPKCSLKPWGKRLWLVGAQSHTHQEALGNPGLSWRRPSCGNQAARQDPTGRACPPRGRRVPLLRPAGGPGASCLSDLGAGPLSARGASRVHLHRDARGDGEREGGRGRGGGARARPDSSALLAHSLVPGFRAQHGGQGADN